MTPSVTESAAFAALRTFLLGVLPSGVEVVKAQDNRVPEPSAPDFVVMTPLRRARLGTNTDVPAENTFTGSISGSVMVVSAAPAGAIIDLGDAIGGTNVVPGLFVSALPPTGTLGSYTLTGTMTLASQALYAGRASATQSTELTVQLDVHGPNAGDNAQTIATLLRDQYASLAMAGTGVAPLYNGDARQIAFVNGEMQYENRWIVEAVLEIDPTVIVPQQFAGSAKVQPQEVL